MTEAELVRDRLTGKHGKTLSHLDELAGGDPNAKSFLEKLADEDQDADT